MHRDRRRRRPWRAAVLLLAALGSVDACQPQEGKRPEDPVRVRITGEDFEWHIVFAGKDGAFDTADDRATRQNLHLPARAHVLLELGSQDYIYSFLLPGMELVEAAIPHLPVEMKMDTAEPSRTELLGSQMCGFAHPKLIGELLVEEPQAFLSWRDALDGAP